MIEPAKVFFDAGQIVSNFIYKFSCSLLGVVCLFRENVMDTIE